MIVANPGHRANAQHALGRQWEDDAPVHRLYAAVALAKIANDGMKRRTDASPPTRPKQATQRNLIIAGPKQARVTKLRQGRGAMTSAQDCSRWNQGGWTKSNPLGLGASTPQFRMLMTRVRFPSPAPLTPGPFRTHG